MTDATCSVCSAARLEGAAFCPRCGTAYDTFAPPIDTETVDERTVAWVAPQAAEASSASGGVMARVGGTWKRYDGALKRRWPRGRWAVHGVTGLVVLSLLGSAAGGRTGENEGEPSPSPIAAGVPTDTAEAPTLAASTPSPTPDATDEPTTTPEPTATPEPTPEPTLEPTPEPTPEPTVALDFEVIELKGRGDKVAKFDIPEDAPAIVKFTHTGTRNFAVWAVDEFGDETDLLVNDIGRYKGSVLFDETGHSVAFNITASGSWTATISPIQKIPKWNGDETRKGTGDYVVRITADTSGLSVMKATHNGSGNFAIWGYGDSGRDLLVNEIGKYSGELLLGDAVVLEITAGGAWTLALTE